MQYNFDEIIDRTGTGSIKHDLREKIFHTPDVIPMWVADMDFKTPQFIMDALRARLDHEILGYTHIPEAFYRAIVNWNQNRNQWNVQPDWISFAPGVVPALNLLVMAFTKPGDDIIVQPPVYFPFFSAVTQHGRNLVRNPLAYVQGEYRMDFEDLESKITQRTRMLFLCSPHNPTGNVWSLADLNELAKICIRNNIIIVSDEIHADLIYPGQHHYPLAAISEAIASHTITCMSASKTFNLAGLSTAYLIISNAGLKRQYDEVLERVHVGAGNIFGYIATQAAYEHGLPWLEQLMSYLEGNLRYLQRFVAEHIPKIHVVNPSATYLVWLDCRTLGMEPEELRSFMIHKAGVGLNNGPQFGKEGEGFQRINIACPRTLLHEALVRMSSAVKKYLQN
jgi:cystathionine beta-lyase